MLYGFSYLNVDACTVLSNNVHLTRIYTILFVINTYGQAVNDVLSDAESRLKLS